MFDVVVVRGKVNVIARFCHERKFATKVGWEKQHNMTILDIYRSLCWGERPKSGARRSFGPTDDHGSCGNINVK